MPLQQHPPPGARLLQIAGDTLSVSLDLHRARHGRAVFRTNLGNASRRRREIIAAAQAGEPPLARDWHDVPMRDLGHGRHVLAIPLTEVGWFAGKACFIPAGSDVPEWPDGGNLAIKVAPAHTACANTVYTAFVRQFGAACHAGPHTSRNAELAAPLLAQNYTVIPPSGTFRDLIARLDTILGVMRFRIIQLLPIHPVPTTFARMGLYGSPFAARDLFDVDPALAVFDTRATPIDQFRELADAVHARGARLFLDIPANHTGWASVLLTHHPDWFRRAPDGAFQSPGAWGVIWADLVELDFANAGLRTFMAEVFLFWCRQGVDGFRCDAGYMIPAETWATVTACVRESFPETVFLLEGLGGKIETTDHLLTAANLDWAYSEAFQMEDRAAFEREFPAAIVRSETCGPLIQFAETHDNNRLAARGESWARLRTALAALLSQQGAFGITAGVEWFASAKLDVHGASPLNWDAPRNQVAAIARLNTLLAGHPAFGAGAAVTLVQIGSSNTLAILRTPPAGRGAPLLALVNLDPDRPQPVAWPVGRFPAAAGSPLWDLLSGEPCADPAGQTHLSPGQVRCLTADPADLPALDAALHAPTSEPPAVRTRRLNLLALRVTGWLEQSREGENPDTLGAALAADPRAFCAQAPARPPHNPSEDSSDDPSPPPVSLSPLTLWTFPADTRRVVPVPPGHLLFVRAPAPFRVRLSDAGTVLASEDSVPFDDGSHGTFLRPPDTRRATAHRFCTLDLSVFDAAGVRHASARFLALAPGGAVPILTCFQDGALRDPGLCALLANGRGAMSQVRAAWGEIGSQYDALLAVNPDPRVPCDRRIFFTRCRTWLRHCGYSHAVDATCLQTFASNPARNDVAWHFHVPCGMGRWTPITVTLSLERGRNRASLAIARGRVRETEADRRADTLTDDDPVTLVLRPDIEWRSFHETTRAFTGPEQDWPRAVQSEACGFVFTPASKETCSIRVPNAAWNPAPEWSYCVAHPEDADRGLAPQGDLFSPGWFGITLRGGESATLVAERADPPGTRPAPKRQAQAHGAAPAMRDALASALDAYLVTRDDLLTVIAGYPWFLDWGRDTLIVLRGLIAAGRTTEVRAVLREFGRFERAGSLPNMIRGNDDANRDTSDAPLWFCVVCADLVRVLGPRAVLTLDCGGRPLADVVASILTHTRDGTPNGIRADPGSGLVYSPAHFTWMDTNHPAGTPRQGYPVEIQALWIAALRFAARHLVRRVPWAAAQADRAQASLDALFWLPGRRITGASPSPWLADCLRAEPGASAAQAVPEDALRPNQLLAVTLGALADPRRAEAVVRACECLLVPGGIRSLADRPVTTPLPVWRDGALLNDPAHPYWGAYRGDEDTRRKPAYHNGTAWTWPFPLYAEALLAVYGPAARDTARALLGSASELLNAGCAGQIPEILDGDAPHAQRGCPAQAWGVSELLRVWALTDA